MRTSSTANFEKWTIETHGDFLPEKSNAPLTLRNAVWICDAHLERNSLRIARNAGLDGHLYVFRGEISANDYHFATGDSLIILGEDAVEVSSPVSADSILFPVNRNAPASRSGTLSG